ncbi:4Fe-4S binding protein [Desulfobacula sp.]|uniref:4Fe-4S binding protein n=1 Tax=Desulfobacula sp. TaxID=2593537 RepID=UPI001EBC7D6C|nr:4Fe-4S binding protein [Desulfobacula sp.]
MTTLHALNEKYRKATKVVCRQGMFPFQVSDTAVNIIKRVVKSEQELDFICAFSKASSQTLDQLMASSRFNEQEIEILASGLAKEGLIFNQPNTKGIMIYRLLPLVMIGLMEYKFMTPLSGSDEERELAVLFETLLEELRDGIQKNYKKLSPLFEAAPALDRTVPTQNTEDGSKITIIKVDKTLDTPEDWVLPSQTIEDIINKFDDIAVGYCFCRQRRNLLGDACATLAPTLNCFTFGKSARHTISQGFAKQITRQKAMEIMKDAENAGLIHKAFHPGSRESSFETSICNCCKDCCDTFNLWRNGTLPMINSTFHLSVIDRDACTGCGICVDFCPTDAITLESDRYAVRQEKSCIGCGVCARFCPEKAISLQEGFRRVFVPPPQTCA